MRKWGPKLRTVGLVLTLCPALLCLAPTGAAANRLLLSEKEVEAQKAPGGVIEGPCGIAFSPSGQIYVSAYHARAVLLFSGGGQFQSLLTAGASPEGPCQLATSTSGALYANRWHEGVTRLLPSPLVFDEAESTGVAVDSSGTVYVNDRTYVAAYEPSSTPVMEGGEPLLIGKGALADAYGLAALEGRLYVADAATHAVKVFEADGAPAGPVDEIDGSATPEGKFVSLVDASLAADPSNGHLLVMDNLQPGFVHPRGAIYEFDAAGNYLGKLPGAPVHGGPSGMAVSAAGTLSVTSGNSEEGAVWSYGPYSASATEPLSGGSGSSPSTPQASLGAIASEMSQRVTSESTSTPASHRGFRAKKRLRCASRRRPRSAPRRAPFHRRCSGSRSLS